MLQTGSLGLLGLFLMPYRRLIGYSRNDDEAVRYLGWKKPIYYDSDLLLGIPPDVADATIVTAQQLDVPTYFQLQHSSAKSFTQ
jgi:hypothetical protein